MCQYYTVLRDCIRQIAVCIHHHQHDNSFNDNNGGGDGDDDDDDDCQYIYELRKNKPDSESIRKGKTSKNDCPITCLSMT